MNQLFIKVFSMINKIFQITEARINYLINNLDSL